MPGKNKESFPMNEFYDITKIPELRDKLEVAERLKTEIDEKRPLRSDIWETIQRKLKIDWTYDSNAIEGSTLTRGETAFFLQEGLTVEGKPLKDFLDARNHAEAIDWLYEVIKGERPISEGLLKEMNSLLLEGITHTKAIDQFGQAVKKPATPGQYKTRPNHVLQPDGTIYYYVEPLQVPGEMERLCQWIDGNIGTLHPVVVGAVSHYNMVRIHPFDDGNGRGARILMNLILIKKGYPPAIVKVEKRRAYLNALSEGDRGNLIPFVELMADSLIATQEMILDDLQN